MRKVSNKSYNLKLPITCTKFDELSHTLIKYNYIRKHYYFIKPA